MKKVLLGLLLIAAVAFFGLRLVRTGETTAQSLALQDVVSRVRDGDLIFQESVSGQSKAIQLATHSKYSHCGIVFMRDGKPFVFEAVQTVQDTPLEEWIARGVNGHFVVRRLKNSGQALTPEALAKMKKLARTFEGKKYDLFFEWSDDRMYCSELAWKLYQRSTGIEVGRLQKMADFDLSNPLVSAAIKKRYGDRFSPDLKVISPAEMLASTLLETVVSN